MILCSEDETGAIPVVAEVVEELGADAFIYGQIKGEDADGLGEQPIVARVEGRHPPARGETVCFSIETVCFSIREGEMHVFSTKTGERLPS